MDQSPAITLILTGDDVAATDPPALQALLAKARQAGADEVIVEIDDVPPFLAAACTTLGLRLLIGITCFHEHGDITLARHPDLWPKEIDGSRRERREWYTGLDPSVPWLRHEILQRAGRLAGHPAVSGVVLDFIRWPLHWELECRPGAPRPVPEISNDELRTRTESRCASITDLVTAVCTDVHKAGASVGAFVVPLPDVDRRELAGQDLAAWPVDVVYPMTYHAVLHQPPSWIADVSDEVRRTARVPVVPVVQVTSDDSYARGADWGPSIDGADFDRALVSASAHATRIAFFPGSALTGSRLRAVRKVSSHTGRA